MSVSGRSGLAQVSVSLTSFDPDFLAVRKIPLNPHAPFPNPAGANMENTEDPEVEELLTRIRSLLLSDRGLSDMVRNTTFQE